MATTKLRIFSSLALSTLLASCGGSGLKTGIFSDSPVSGLTYTTSTADGVTDEDGRFEYREGETVVFSIGSLALPVVVGTELVTPLDMAGSDDITDPSVVNIARLLQSLDEDSNPDNGISIPAGAAYSFTETAIFDATDDAAVDAVVSQLYSDGRQAVSADQAIAHFVDSLSADTGSEATLDQLQYIVPVGAAFDGESLYVDDRNFTLSIDGEDHSGTTTVINGVYQLAGADDQWFVSVQDANTRLACISKAPEAVSECSGDTYHVFKEEQAALDFSAADSNRAESQNSTNVNSGPATGAATDESDIAQQVDVADQNSTATSTPASTGDEVTLRDLFSECAPGTVDGDGDGFGWENNQTCLIVVGGVVVAEQVNATDTGNATEQSGALVPAESVPDTVAEVSVPEVAVPEATVPSVTVPSVTTPSVTVPEVAAPAPVLVPAPAPALAPAVTQPVTQPIASAPGPQTAPVTSVQPEDITDIIVLTGQANAAAVQTDYDAALDTGNERLFAFNEDGQWRVADLNQHWDVNLPGNFSSPAEGRDPYNNLAFQIGKSLSEQTDRVVGIIMITASGEGISHWDFNSTFYQQIRTKVNAALALLPQKTSVDAMIWMQGETDWLAEGTADPGATGFTSIDSDFYRNYYPNKLNQLIANLRSESWYGFNAQFICGETKKTDLNPHLNSLNSDGDNLTACAAASDLPTRASDPFGNHFSADGLRTLGGRFAQLYLSGAL